MKKSCLIVVLIVLLCLAFSACGQKADPAPVTPQDPVASNDPVDGDYVWEQDYVWKLTHEGPPGPGGEDVCAQAFAKLINERSDGHITVEIYDFNQLGSSTDQFELVQSGAVEFGIGNAGALASLVPEVGVFGLHYVLPTDADNCWDFLGDSEFIDLINEIMLDGGFKCFTWNTEGSHVWSINKEIHTPEQMKGVKFRTQANQIEMASFSAYGASPTTIPFAELYSALQLGTIDAQQQTTFGNNLMCYYEVTDYYISPNASYYIDMPLCGADFYNSLPAYVQQLIVDCFNEIRPELQRQVAEDKITQTDLAVNEYDITYIEFTAEEQAAFAEQAAAAHETYLKIGGPRAQEVLDILLREVGERY